MCEQYFRCHCCDDRFYSDKPQDPERDIGYGTCEKCKPSVAASWVKHGFPGCPVLNRDRPDQVKTTADAYARFARYA